LKPLISFGASPGSINLANAAKCYAFIKRRGYVIPEDVRAVVHDVLRHRMVLLMKQKLKILPLLILSIKL
jgi:MoxR-like ATPase